MRRLLVIVLLAAGLLVVPGTADAAPSTRACSVTWGSQEKSAGPSTSPRSPVDDARTGEHACFDRFVVDLRGPASGYVVHYVNTFGGVATGDPIPLAGGAKLEVVVRAPDHTIGGTTPTYDGREGRRLPRVDVTGYQTFRAAKYGGSFEGVTLFGLGVRARLPFRVFKLDDRIVVDVAHSWS